MKISVVHLLYWHNQRHYYYYNIINSVLREVVFTYGIQCTCVEIKNEQHSNNFSLVRTICLITQHQKSVFLVNRIVGIFARSIESKILVQMSRSP